MKPAIHLKDEEASRNKGLSKCGANRGLNLGRKVELTTDKRAVTCLTCRSYIKPWERGDKRLK